MTQPTPSDPAIRFVFVYGTLMPGYGNHFVATRVATPEATPATLPGFLIYPVSGFPGIVRSPDPATHVRGVLLTYPDGTLPQALEDMDRLEGYRPSDPEGSMYLRETVTVTTEDGREVTAYTYVWNAPIPAHWQPCPDGRWMSRTEWEAWQEQPDAAFDDTPEPPMYV